MQTTRFKIVVPSYNSMPWLENNLEMLEQQTHKNFDVCVIDDASTMEGQQETIEAFAARNGWKTIFNETNQGMLYNIVEGIKALECEDEDVVIVIDGDDWLYNEHVLAIVDEAYRTERPLMTYGQFINYYSGELGYAKRMRSGWIRFGRQRKHEWIFGQLRTFKYALWRRIKDQDLRDKNREYFSTASDVAFTFPLVEMAGDRILCIPNVLYCRNDENPLSDHIKCPKEQQATEKMIRKKKRYRPVYIPLANSKPPTRFKIVVPSYNAYPWIRRCLQFIADQEYEHFDVCVIDDCSTDPKHAAVCEEFCSKYGWLHIRNGENKGALYNIVNGIKALNCHDEDVILVIDGDDWLANELVLTKLDKVYREEEPFLTYGQYLSVNAGLPGCATPFSKKVVGKRDYRNAPWAFSHLRTFKYLLWRRIRDEDLRGPDGEYFAVAWDLAMMFPMAEMARRRIRFFSEVLYMYNDLNPISDHNIKAQAQKEADQYIRGLPKYDVLPCAYRKKRKKAPLLFMAQWDEVVSTDHPLFAKVKERLHGQGFRFSAGHYSQIPKRCDAVIAWNPKPPALMPKEIKRIPKRKRQAWIWEPPAVCHSTHEAPFYEQFSSAYFLRDDVVDNKRRFHFLYPYHFSFTDQVNAFDQKKLVGMVVGNKDSDHPSEIYSDRLELIHFFEERGGDDFDLYGKGWEESGLKTYRGALANKFETLAGYRFGVAYENSRIKGYITEKIFDCFVAGCVPIYWGAPNVEEYIPKNTFIHRQDFTSNEALLAYLQEMSEEEHKEYLQNARSFMEEEANGHDSERFIDNFVQAATTLLEGRYAV